jgi:hypothetical protein
MRDGVTYRAFLLRLWRGSGDQWYASLDDPHTGERRAFATLEQLVEFLTTLTRPGGDRAATGEAPASPRNLGEISGGKPIS